MIRLEEMTPETLPLVNAQTPAFPVVGRVLPRLENGAWSYTWEPLPPGEMKCYPQEDYTSYLNREDRRVFLALTEAGQCAGYLAVSTSWNGWGWVDCLYVHAPWRGQGVAKRLFSTAVDWAKEKRMLGLGLETQDNNLPACRFYARMGMKLGGANSMLYKRFGGRIAEETALYWYLSFAPEDKAQ